MRRSPSAAPRERKNRPAARPRQGTDGAVAGGALCGHGKIRAEAGAAHLKTLPPSIAVWLAAIAHIRHAHTDYETLLAEGYDRDSARFFVIGQINDVLTRWRATRLLDADDDDA